MSSTPVAGGAIRWASAALLVAATAALFWVVPDQPFTHLDDPNYWGVIGYAVTVLALGRLWLIGPRGNRAEQRLLMLFLAGMPVIYLADWLRFGGPTVWLAIELGGGALYWTLAWLATRRSPWFLAVGIAGHALWDLGHHGRTTFVPDWYVIACIVVDLALGLYVVGRVMAWRAESAPQAG